MFFFSYFPPQGCGPTVTVSQSSRQMTRVKFLFRKHPPPTPPVGVIVKTRNANSRRHHDPGPLCDREQAQATSTASEPWIQQDGRKPPCSSTRAVSTVASTFGCGVKLDTRSVKRTRSTQGPHATHFCTTIANVQPSILHRRIRELPPLSNDMEIHPLPTCATVRAGGVQYRTRERDESIRTRAPCSSRRQGAARCFPTSACFAPRNYHKATAARPQ